MCDWADFFYVRVCEKRKYLEAQLLAISGSGATRFRPRRLISVFGKPLNIYISVSFRAITKISTILEG